MRRKCGSGQSIQCLTKFSYEYFDSINVSALWQHNHSKLFQYLWVLFKILSKYSVPNQLFFWILCSMQHLRKIYDKLYLERLFRVIVWLFRVPIFFVILILEANWPPDKGHPKFMSQIFAQKVTRIVSDLPKVTVSLKKRLTYRKVPSKIGILSYLNLAVVDFHVALKIACWILSQKQ